MMQEAPSFLFSTGTISLLTEQEPTHTTQEDESKNDSTSPSSHPEPAENGILPDDDATSFSQLHATDPKNLSFCISPLALMLLETLDLGDIYGFKISHPNGQRRDLS